MYLLVHKWALFDYRIQLIYNLGSFFYQIFIIIRKYIVIILILLLLF